MRKYTILSSISLLLLSLICSYASAGTSIDIIASLNPQASKSGDTFMFKVVKLDCATTDHAQMSVPTTGTVSTVVDTDPGDVLKPGSCAYQDSSFEVDYYYAPKGAVAGYDIWFYFAVFNEKNSGVWKLTQTGHLAGTAYSIAELYVQGSQYNATIEPYAP